MRSGLFHCILPGAPLKITRLVRDFSDRPAGIDTPCIPGYLVLSPSEKDGFFVLGRAPHASHRREPLSPADQDPAAASSTHGGDDGAISTVQMNPTA